MVQLPLTTYCRQKQLARQLPRVRCFLEARTMAEQVMVLIFQEVMAQTRIHLVQLCEPGPHRHVREEVQASSHRREARPRCPASLLVLIEQSVRTLQSQLHGARQRMLRPAVRQATELRLQSRIHLQPILLVLLAVVPPCLFQIANLPLNWVVEACSCHRREVRLHSLREVDQRRR